MQKVASSDHNMEREDRESRDIECVSGTKVTADTPQTDIAQGGVDRDTSTEQVLCFSYALDNPGPRPGLPLIVLAYCSRASSFVLFALIVCRAAPEPTSQCQSNKSAYTS
jgi:hypothetical protein